MRKGIALALAALAAALTLAVGASAVEPAAAVAPQAAVWSCYVGTCTSTGFGNTAEINSWSWKSTPSQGRRVNNAMRLPITTQCLPYYARMEIRYRYANGGIAGMQYGQWGACGERQIEDRQGTVGAYAYAECRIYSSAGGVARQGYCFSQWY